MNHPPTRASERIQRRKELRQTRLQAARRRRARRTWVLIILALLGLVLLSLAVWFGLALLFPAAAASLGSTAAGWTVLLPVAGWRTSDDLREKLWHESWWSTTSLRSSIPSDTT